ncbi:MAG: methionyl-tRNA formyltransferase [Clostridia bacterium]
MRILYMGTPDFAAHSLQTLIDNKHEVIGVFTRQDTPKGRGMKMMPTPVKEVALKYDIPVFQPKTLKEDGVFDTISSLNPDIIVVVAYGRLLPEEILNFPKFGCINVHGSLLPKYRGAAPIQWAVLNGDKITGITTMYMSKGLDEGDMILKDVIEIEKNETSGELFERLMVLGGQTLLKTLTEIKEGTAPRIPQDNDEATFAPMLSKEMGNLDFSQSADELLCKIYGLNPWPSAYTTLNGNKIKIFSAEKVENYDKNIEVGTIFDVNDGLSVACGENSAIFVTEIQVIGKKRMAVREYLKGNRIENGSKFTKE